MGLPGSRPTTRASPLNLALPGFVWVLWFQIVPQIVCEKEGHRFLPFVRGGLR